MLLIVVKDEFIFNCQCRKLSDTTVKNYEKQIGYLLNFLQQEKSIEEIEDVQPQHIKQFLLKMKQSGRKVSYMNDLLICLRKMALTNGISDEHFYRRWR